jgi:tRNA A37 N6-isopentenylltransferase MiaA
MGNPLHFVLVWTAAQNVAKRRRVQPGRCSRHPPADRQHLSREAPVLIAGPTASGKSALAMELAARDGRVIVNADALQVYENWRILTARPSLRMRQPCPTRFTAMSGAMQPYSVGHWLREVAPFLTRPVVIVGGTGLNFTALTAGLPTFPRFPPRSVPRRPAQDERDRSRRPCWPNLTH